jgi:transposase
VITMVMYAKIRRMYFRDKLSISEIARKTSLSWNTVKKWIEGPADKEIKYHRAPSDKILKPFEPWLLQALKADSYRPKRDRRSALMLYGAIKKQGFTGHYCRVTEFVRNWRQHGDGIAAKSAFVPLKFQLGEAFQFDWSEESLVIGGILRKVIASHTKLCASRAFFISGYPGQSHEMLFDAHNRAFAALGGIPKRGIYDNMKTAVDKISKGNGRIVNTRFYAMVSHYLFDADFCNVASGWEKGIVEKNVQDARRRIWIDAKQQKFSSFDELNIWLDARCRALWSELEHPDYAGITVADALEQEQPYLMAVPTLFDGYVETTGRVSSTCLVSVDRNRYSVPCRLANRMVSIHLYANKVSFYDESGHVASHRRLLDRDQTSYDWLHYVPLIERKPGALRNGAPFEDMPPQLVKLQAALLRRERQEGSRLMSKVLAAVPVHGLEAVLVAVELVLESGIHSAEHVLNVLARLNQQPMPAKVETNLKLNEEPVADTARYDSLADQEVEHE